ncbi:hypothetical protein [Rhizobium fabae]|uniref:Uncharacterized protein n=1 Tax=Rhizobium fabae TaxID=573179 RepID=A0A7W6BD78_9HYPH|nr:hypothetical protein [Rhizobium fabae]MBB3915571.1 hypothetical protein [Rhizobium fabae]RUM11848.1 hypothetical protein EFB14_15785 [Rhizobium fabae]
MSIQQSQKFFMDLGRLLGELKADLEVVVESKTDLPSEVIDGFKLHIDQADAMESQINDIVAQAALTKRGL